ncbi:MAG: sugar phosphate isomerase/epimerase [Spirochaetales bacterium]|nr:sugar phosphate isomerase/epimerase [Spirochaetales bacterium]
MSADHSEVERTEHRAPITDLRRCAVHTVTTKPWPIETAIDEYARAGFGGISIWRDAMEGRDPVAIRRRMREAGLTGVSLVRGGFLAHDNGSARAKALSDNRRCIEEAHELGLPLIVLVCGADPHLAPEESRRMIADALHELAPEARSAGVALGIEPLHPMYADTRSAINTLAQAVRIAREVNGAAAPVDEHPAVVGVVDVYHLWWDENLPRDIAETGSAGFLAAFHVCDWRVPTEHMLLDRGLMGEGCIDIPAIRNEVERAGFDGLIEVEIFSERYWAMDQAEWLNMIAGACRNAV